MDYAVSIWVWVGIAIVSFVSLLFSKLISAFEHDPHGNADATCCGEAHSTVVLHCREFDGDLICRL